MLLPCLAIVNSAAMNITVNVRFKIRLFFPPQIKKIKIKKKIKKIKLDFLSFLDMCPGMGLLDYVLAQFKISGFNLCTFFSRATLWVISELNFQANKYIK